MNIEVTTNKPIIYFGSILQGYPFKVIADNGNTEYYVKTNDIASETEGFNAMRVDTGEMHFFYDDDKVVTVNGRFTVDE